MSKELKLLIISLLLLIGSVVCIYLSQNYTCYNQEYQDLQGPHTKTVCQDNKTKTCWDNYSTEHDAILNCERNN